MRTILGVTAVAGMAVAVASSAPAQPKPTATCDQASMQAASPAGTNITKVEKLTTPVPHCRIDGYFVPEGTARVSFRVQLPDKALWKGRFYFIGLGGSAGYVPTDSQSPGGNPISAGFAVAGTDTGTSKSGDWSFQSDPVMMVNHRDRGAHLTTVAAQQMVKAYYGVDKMWRYHTGCSGGGGMGARAINFHPE